MQARQITSTRFCFWFGFIESLRTQQHPFQLGLGLGPQLPQAKNSKRMNSDPHISLQLILGSQQSPNLLKQDSNSWTCWTDLLIVYELLDSLLVRCEILAMTKAIKRASRRQSVFACSQMQAS